jgi:hypothetical protein
MLPNESKFAQIELDAVFHVGTLDSAQKGTRHRHSQEGNGLSVSLRPHEWAQIAKLGGGRLYRLEKSDGAFLDYHRIAPRIRRALEAWTLDQGWAQLGTRWRVEWYDSQEVGRRYLLVESQEAAQAEVGSFVGDASATMNPVQVFCATAKLIERIGFAPDPIETLDFTTTCWVEDCTALDGVWWDDTLSPDDLSAPRGVINLKSLPAWTVLDQGPLYPLRR